MKSFTPLSDSDSSQSSKQAWPPALFWSLTVITLLAAGTIGGFLADYLSRDLPNPEELENFEPFQVTRIYSRDHKLIHELFNEKRRVIPLDMMPQYLIDATVATEDRTFYDHWGVSLRGGIRAVVTNVQTMEFTEGFSTLTMQLSRQLYLNPKKEITRKLKEILTTLQIERRYSKDEILEMYLNNSYFGVGVDRTAAYGVVAASRAYFDKQVQNLTLAESALLIAQLKAPTHYSPVEHPEAALSRRRVVLHNMAEMGYITEQELEDADQEPITLKSNETEDFRDLGKYFTEYVRLELQDRQKEIGFDLWRDGVTVYTTLDSRLQAIAEKAYQENLQNVQARTAHNIRRRLVELGRTPADIDTTVQGALVALDVKTGKILAMIGGRDFNKYKFNRATQSTRQPGSTFKIFPYTAAIDNGYAPSYRLLNQPVVMFNPDGTRWSPENYDGEGWGGLTTLRYGLEHSLNVLSVRVVSQLIPAEQVIAYAHQMGIHADLQPYPTVAALGATGVKIIELVSAYAVLANNGIYTQPSAIEKIVDRFGNTIYEHKPVQHEALSAETAYIMTDMLRSVILHGTGGTSRYRYQFLRPAAGKTGTTNDFTDGWFIGYTPQIVTGVWTGFDQPTLTLGKRESGAVVALPAWANFMREAHDVLDLPIEDFKAPPGVIEEDICTETYLPATRHCPNRMKEIFNRKYMPKNRCNVHTGISYLP